MAAKRPLPSSEHWGLSKVDVLGFLHSAAFVAQQIAGQAPSLVRKLVPLSGTGPRGWARGHGANFCTAPKRNRFFGGKLRRNPTTSGFAVHFHQVRKQAQAAGRGFPSSEFSACARRNRDPEGQRTGGARHNSKALGKWGNSGSKGVVRLP